jgi:Carbohydrate-binding family 9
VTSGPDKPSYLVRRVEDFGPGFAGPEPWDKLPSVPVDHYLWLKNGYEPRVEAWLCWSRKFLYVRFRVGERKAPVRYREFQDPVYKDSCVEFFVDMFPEKSLGYANFEMNADGTLLAQFGPGRDRRKTLWPEDLAMTYVIHGEVGDSWHVEYDIPLELFRKLYGEEITPGHQAAANFYKCGDETAVPHYGAWSPVGTPRPDFHRPEFFGRLIFE